MCLIQWICLRFIVHCWTCTHIALWKILLKWLQWYHFVAVGVKVLRDCGVQTAEVDMFSDPQGKKSIFDMDSSLWKCQNDVFCPWLKQCKHHILVPIISAAAEGANLALFSYDTLKSSKKLEVDLQPHKHVTESDLKR